MIVKYQNVTREELINYIKLNGLGLYDRCVCQSGKKFKYCCYNKKIIKYNDSDANAWQGRINSQIIKKSAPMDNRCIYSDCEKTSIRSHVLQKEGVLNLVSPDDKVYRYIKTYDKSKYSMSSKYELSRSATIFYGFCSMHDDILFKEIETCAGQLSRKSHLYTYTYRCLANYYKELNHQLYIIEKDHFSLQPLLYSDTPIHKYIDYQALTINNYNNLKYCFVCVKKALEDIAKNFNGEEKKWDISDEVLCLSNVIDFDVKINEMAFYNSTVRHTRHKLIPKNYMDLFSLYNEEIITTIIIPAKDGKVKGFISSYSKSLERSSFIDYFDRSTKQLQKNILNNIIMDNNNEFYFSSKKWESILDDINFDDYNDYLLKNHILYYSSYSIDVLTKTPIVDFLCKDD